MFKIKNKKNRKKENTQNLKYQSLLEDKNRQNEKMIDLQDKVIGLLDELRKRDTELLEIKEQQINDYKKKIKKEKEKK